MAHILASRKASSDYTALRILRRHSPGYVFSFGISLVKVGLYKKRNLHYSIETQNRLTTKINNTEWLIMEEKSSIPQTIRTFVVLEIWRLGKHLLIMRP